MGILAKVKRIISILIILITLPYIANSCEEPEPGMLLSKENLLELAKEIFLVKLTNEHKNSQGNKLVFEVIEIIKGQKKRKLVFYPFTELEFQSSYDTTTFNNHTDSTFWNAGKGRCQFPCCVCAPYHTFRIGDTYLLFPEYNGSPYHCERIQSTEKDNWLKYARDFCQKK